MVSSVTHHSDADYAPKATPPGGRHVWNVQKGILLSMSDVCRDLVLDATESGDDDAN